MESGVLSRVLDAPCAAAGVGGVEAGVLVCDDLDDVDVAVYVWHRLVWCRARQKLALIGGSR